MNLHRPLLILGLPLLCIMAARAAQPAAQDTLNRLDDQGRKQGYWKVIAPRPDKPNYPDGQLIEEGRYEKGKRLGTWKRYWPTGKVMSEVTYRFGVPRGDYRTYYPNGKPEEEGTWDLDRNTGNFKRYHPNGKPAQEFIFDQYGMRNGTQKYYHENGRLAVEVPIVNGRESGTMKRWFENGELEQVAVFNNGEIDEAKSTWYKPKGSLPAEAPAADAKPAPAPASDESTNLSRFRENGHNTLYDRQLRLSQVGEFKDGRLWMGRIYRYGKDGVLARIEVYLQGRYAGEAPITEEDLK